MVRSAFFQHFNIPKIYSTRPLTSIADKVGLVEASTQILSTHVSDSWIINLWRRKFLLSTYPYAIFLDGSKNKGKKGNFLTFQTKAQHKQ